MNECFNENQNDDFKKSLMIRDSLICALGAEVYFRRLGDRISVTLVSLLMLWPMYTGIDGYLQSRDSPVFNPSTAVIEKLRCNKHKTVVLGVPRYIGKVP